VVDLCIQTSNALLLASGGASAIGRSGACIEFPYPSAPEVSLIGNQRKLQATPAQSSTGVLLLVCQGERNDSPECLTRTGG